MAEFFEDGFSFYGQSAGGAFSMPWSGPLAAVFAVAF